MKSARHNGEWWIIDCPAYDAGGETHTSIGPYPTKQDAESDRRGLEFFWKHEANRTPRKPKVTPTAARAELAEPSEPTGPQRTLFA